MYHWILAVVAAIDFAVNVGLSAAMPIASGGRSHRAETVGSIGVMLGLSTLRALAVLFLLFTKFPVRLVMFNVAVSASALVVLLRLSLGGVTRACWPMSASAAVGTLLLVSVFFIGIAQRGSQYWVDIGSSEDVSVGILGVISGPGKMPVPGGVSRRTRNVPRSTNSSKDTQPLLVDAAEYYDYSYSYYSDDDSSDEIICSTQPTKPPSSPQPSLLSSAPHSIILINTSESSSTSIRSIPNSPLLPLSSVASSSSLPLKPSTTHPNPVKLTAAEKIHQQFLVNLATLPCDISLAIFTHGTTIHTAIPTIPAIPTNLDLLQIIAHDTLQAPHHHAAVHEKVSFTHSTTHDKAHTATPNNALFASHALLFKYLTTLSPKYLTSSIDTLKLAHDVIVSKSIAPIFAHTSPIPPSLLRAEIFLYRGLGLALSGRTIKASVAISNSAKIYREWILESKSHKSVFQIRSSNPQDPRPSSPTSLDTSRVRFGLALIQVLSRFHNLNLTDYSATTTAAPLSILKHYEMYTEMTDSQSAYRGFAAGIVAILLRYLPTTDFCTRRKHALEIQDSLDGFEPIQRIVSGLGFGFEIGFGIGKTTILIDPSLRTGLEIYQDAKQAFMESRDLALFLQLRESFAQFQIGITDQPFSNLQSRITCFCISDPKIIIADLPVMDVSSSLGLGLFTTELWAFHFLEIIKQNNLETTIGSTEFGTGLRNIAGLWIVYFEGGFSSLDDDAYISKLVVWLHEMSVVCSTIRLLARFLCLNALCI